MAQDLNSSDIDGENLCNLALETCANAAEAKFLNIELITRATAYFLEAIEVKPSNYRAHLGMGILLIGGKMYNEAIKYLQNAYDLNPSPEIESYMEIVSQVLETEKLNKVEVVVTKKKATVDDLLDLSNKFKIK
jgi:tetratricopeptide (TPR) repeat protein